MFKFGVFDLKISILMPIFKDINLCKELSEFINIRDSIQDILFTLSTIDISEISEENKEKFINFKMSNEKEVEYFIINDVNNFDVGYNQFIIKKNDDKFLFYNLEGDYIFKYLDKNHINTDIYNRINDINKIWEIVLISDGQIFLR